MLLTVASRSLVIAASGTAVTPSGSEAAAANPAGTRKKTAVARDHRERSFIEVEWIGDGGKDQSGGAPARGFGRDPFLHGMAPAAGTRRGITCVAAGPL